MKNILKTMICLLTLPINAQINSKQGHIDIQRTVFEEQLAEGHILQFEFENKMAELNGMEHLILAARTQQNLVKSGPAGTASVSGTVQVSSIDESDVELYLYHIGTNAFAGSALSDAKGAFTIPDLAAGDYYLVANGFNDIYINAMWSSTVTEQCSRCVPDGDNTISLADAENRVSVDMDLVIGASISGQVLDGVTPLDMISVNLRPLDSQGFFGNATTDAGGNFTIQGLGAGDYYLFVADQTDAYVDVQWTSAGTVVCINCQPDPAGTVTLTPGDVLNGFDFSLTVGATLTGQITDATTMAAVETLNINVFEPTEMINGGLYTEFDGAGNYTVRGIPQGNYKVYLAPNFSAVNEHVPEIYNDIQCNLCSTMVFNGAGDLVSLTNGMTTSGIDFSLNVGASISGAILNGSHLPETVEELGLIFIFNVSNRLIATQFLNGSNHDPLFNGSFKIGGLLPGTYFIQGGDLGREFFQRELYNDIRCPWSGCDRGGGGDPVVLGAGEQRLGINFLLEYGGKISGTVTDAMTGLPISSERPQFIQFYDSAGLVAGGAGIDPNDGTYTSQRALPPGTYSVRTGSMFTGNFNAPFVMQKYDSAGNIDCPGITCDLTAGNVVVPAYVRQVPRDRVAEAAAATVTGIDFALSTAFSFSGTITELGSPNPIPDVHVLVYDDVGNFATWATTDAMGDFTVSGLPAGTYYALTNNGSNLPLLGFFPEEAGGWIDILFDGTPCPGSACDVTTGDPIVLGGPIINAAEGAPVLDFSLSAGGTITGQVNTFGSSLPARYVDVNVYNNDGVFYGSYPSDDSGFYMTAGLPAGNYYLTTANDGGLVDAKYGGDYCIEGNCDPLDAVPVVITANQSLTDIDFDLRTDYLFKNGLD